MLKSQIVNAPAFRRSMEKARSKVRLAGVMAATRSAKAVAKDESEEVTQVFDRPRPFTEKAFYTQPATMADPSAVVGVKRFAGKGTPASKYLLSQVTGGMRKQKRSERALSARGLMRGYQFWVPGSGIKLDAYGNISGRTMVRILSDLQSSSDGSQNRTARSVSKNANYRRQRFFVPSPGSSLAPGVWVRQGGQIKPALIFVASSAYRMRFDFYGVGHRSVARNYPIEMSKAMNQLFRAKSG